VCLQFDSHWERLPVEFLSFEESIVHVPGVPQVFATCRLNEDKRLLFDPSKLEGAAVTDPREKEVSVVYFRAGYTPNDYKDDNDWAARMLIERSFAVKVTSLPRFPCHRFFVWITFVISSARMWRITLLAPKRCNKRWQHLGLWKSLSASPMLPSFGRLLRACGHWILTPLRKQV
jgi:Eukaryotic glutathione synthase